MQRMEQLLKKYWNGAHTRHRMMYHIVWLLKYRRRVLKRRLASRLIQLINECAQVNSWHVHELNVQSDHVHILLQAQPLITVSKIVQLIKGGTSKKIKQEFPDLEEFLWGDSLWNDGYFVETIGIAWRKSYANILKISRYFLLT